MKRDPRLEAILDLAVNEWGAMGVALAAAERTDIPVLIERLSPGRHRDTSPNMSPEDY